MNFNKLAVSILISFLFVIKSFGLTGGPTQPEFTSFEPVDVTDLVNLPTGDFSYVIPLGDVKGPEGVGYPIALSYHAGIQLEQEASWVGLGWTLNAGAISRMVRGTADDMNGGQIYSYLCDKGKNGYNFNIGGGWGPIAGTVGFSEKGFQGVTSIGVSYNIGIVGVGATYNPQSGNLSIGLNAGFAAAGGNAGIGLGVGVNIATKNEAAVSGFAYVGLSSSGMSLASFSIESSGQKGYSAGGASYSSTQHTSEGVSNQSSGFGLTIPLPYGLRFDFSCSTWGWKYSQFLYGKSYGYLFQSPNYTQELTSNNPVLKAYLKHRPGGSSQNVGVAIDPNVKPNHDKLDFLGGTNFLLGPQDLYNITGQGISGTFKPISRVRMTTYETTTNLWDGDDDQNANYGMYDSDGKYTEAYNTASGGFGLDNKAGITFKLMGEKALNSAQYSLNADGTYTKTIDDRTYGTRIEPLFGTDAAHPGKLNGFVITDQEGKTYYYTLPLYNYEQVAYTTDGSGIPDNTLRPVKEGENQSYSYRIDLNPYATTWLLTAITGPDYIKHSAIDDVTSDFNEILLPHQGDLGYWVTFRYSYGENIIESNGQPVLQSAVSDIGTGNIKKSQYLWREPFQGTKTNKCATLRYSVTYGIKDITYLKSIETASEIAFFRTSPRFDGIGASNESVASVQKTTIDKLKVSEQGTVKWGYDVKWYKQWVPVLNPDAKSFNETMKITLKKSDLPSNFMSTLNQGDKLFNLKFSATERTRYTWFGANYRTEHNIGDKDVTNNMVVVYDNSGWNFQGTTPTPQSEDLAKAMSTGVTSKLSNIYSIMMRNFFDQSSPDFHTDYFKTPYAKCFYVEDDLNGNYNFYVIGYKFQTNTNAKDEVRTGLQLTNDYYIWHKWYQCWILEPFKDVTFVGGEILYNNYGFSGVSVVNRYQKKLDEIAWYSKAEYPYINSYTDPAAEGARENSPWNDDMPYPESYKRVKFSYSYELAKKYTPNSYDPVSKAIGNGGRLTLKEVRTEGGAENSSVSMPPYLFKYENYITYSHEADKWGYLRERTNDSYTSPASGVIWNLKEIKLPSCGSLQINYERDMINSIYGTLAKMRDDNECENGKDFDWNSYDFTNGGLYPIGDYYTFADILDQNNTTCEYKIDLPFEPKLNMICISDVKLKNGYKAVSISVVTKIRKEGQYYWIALNDDPYYFYDYTRVAEHRIEFIKSRKLYCDGIRTQNIISKSLTNSYKTMYIYPPNGGDIDILPENAIPWWICKDVLTDRVNRSTAFGKQFSSDPSENFSTGNTSVIYPYVDVALLRENANGSVLPNGYTRYSFYTPKDSIDVGYNNTVKRIPLMYETGSYLPHFEDYTALIGQTKKVEIINKEGDVVKFDSTEYAFGPDLERSNKRIIYKTLANNYTPILPLGSITENMESKVPPDAIFDFGGTTISVYTPFITKHIQKLDNVASTVDYDFFDAYTGDPMAQSETSVSNEPTNTKVKTTFNIPYLYCAPESKRLLLASKNLYKQNGISIVTDKTNLNSLGKIPDLFSYTFNNILKADAKIYEITPYSEDVLKLGQNRFYLKNEYSWKGRTPASSHDLFNWQEGTNGELGNQWRLNYAVDAIDEFSRPLTVKNALNQYTSAVYLNNTNLVAATVSGSKYSEVAFFTCDNDDYIEIKAVDGTYLDDGFFDKKQGWNKGQAALSKEQIHFGKKSVKLSRIGDSNCGPWKYLYSVNKNKSYTFSAWVYPVNINTDPICLAVDKCNGSSEESILSSGEIYNNLTTGKWQLISRTIPKSELSKLADGDFIKISICSRKQDRTAANAVFYVDDIRFHPSDAIVNTYYYDLQLGKPITFVDPNNNANYFKYDMVGKLIEKGIIKK